MKSYNPASVVVEFGGIITGYADGSFVTAGRAEDVWKLIIGADGLACRVRSQNASGMVSLTLMQGSPSNDILGALASLDERSGSGVLPFMIKDLNGSAIAVAAEAWITKPADLGFAKDLTDRVWAICCADLQLEGGAIF